MKGTDEVFTDYEKYLKRYVVEVDRRQDETKG